MITHCILQTNIVQFLHGIMKECHVFIHKLKSFLRLVFTMSLATYDVGHVLDALTHAELVYKSKVIR